MRFQNCLFALQISNTENSVRDFCEIIEEKYKTFRIIADHSFGFSYKEIKNRKKYELDVYESFDEAFDQDFLDLVENLKGKNCYFQQILDPLPTGETVSFLTVYECESVERLRKYRENDAPKLMAEHEKKFGGSFTAQRFVGAPLRVPEGKVKF